MEETEERAAVEEAKGEEVEVATVAVAPAEATAAAEKAAEAVAETEARSTRGPPHECAR